MKKLAIIILLMISYQFESIGQAACYNDKKFIKAELKSILKDDQKYRSYTHKVRNRPLKYKRINPDSLMKLQAQLDSINLERVLLLIKKYDCLNSDYFGNRFFLFAIHAVFIHNPDRMHDSIVNTVIKNEIANGYLKADGFIAGYDRFLLAQGKPPLYGGYAGKVPCENDFVIVNKARRELNLKEFTKEQLIKCN